MTSTITHTFNRDDIRRVCASFAAEYKIIAEWTELQSTTFVETTIEQIRALAEEQYLKEVHLQLTSASGEIREGAVYRVATNAAGWSCDRPGDLYWDHDDGDRLHLVVFFSQKWRDLGQKARENFATIHMPDWGTSDFDGEYGSLVASNNRRFASGGYGMERTHYS